jgi:hypothetical protein
VLRIGVTAPGDGYVKRIEVELLFFDGCPTWEHALDLVRAVVAELELQTSTTIRLVKVMDEEQARRLEFPGSPTVRVNGRDVEPSPAGGREIGLQCRVYRMSDGRLRGFPPRGLVRASLLELAR